MDCRIKSGNDEERRKERKRRRNADRRLYPSSAPAGAAPRPAGRVHLSAFHRGSRQREYSSRWLSFRPGFLGRGRSARSGTPAPTGGRRPCAVLAGVTRARLSQSRECTSRTGRSAGQMMPEAARERTVSFRPRAPHSLHLGEYPRPKASSMSEIRVSCNGNGDRCQEEKSPL